jgi:hypothetical protein
MIESVEINIREKLAGQIANWQAAPALRRREKIVVGEVPIELDLRVAAVDNLVDQPQSFGVRDDAANELFQNLVIDAGKILAQVNFQNVLCLLHELLQPPNGGVSSFAHAVGIAVENKPALEERADDIDEHVVHDAVAKGRGTDEALFRLVNQEGFVIAGLIREGAQLVQKLQRIPLEITEEGEHVRTEAFASRGFSSRRQKIFERADLGVEVFISFHKIKNVIPQESFLVSSTVLA